MDLSELDKRPGVLAFLAGATLIGTIGIGKAAVDAAHSKIRYPGGDDKAMGESVRVIGSLFGITLGLLQLPKAWEEAQKFLQSGNLP